MRHIIYHGQWWSILLMQRLQILQWCALGGLYVSHLVHTVQSSFSSPSWSSLPPEAWISEKSILFCGRGTIPGSLQTAFKCAIIKRSTTVLNATIWKGPHKLRKNRKKTLLKIHLNILYKKSTIKILNPESIQI